MRTIENKEIIDYLFSDFEHYNFILTEKSTEYKGIECEDCEGVGYVDCDECNGYGNMDCSNCGGDGNEECNTCNGSSKITCNDCGGEGQIEKGEDTIDCEECEGSGDLDCEECGGEGEVLCGFCDDGKEECYDCGGAGNNDCHKCDGMGVVSPNTGKNEIDESKDIIVGVSRNIKYTLKSVYDWNCSHFIIALCAKLDVNVGFRTKLKQDQISKIDTTLIQDVSKGNKSMEIVLKVLMRFNRRISIYPDLIYNVLIHDYDETISMKIQIYDSSADDTDKSVSIKEYNSEGLSYEG